MLREEVKAKKTYTLLDEKTSKLALKHGLEINENILKNTKVINVNMFTHRFMGFGGKVAGAPFANPIYNWYNLYKKEKKESL